MNSALHVHADEPQLDMSALTYAILRLPDCLHETKLVLMGQSETVFAQHGYPDVESWQQVSAPGRRRRSFYNGEGTLALYIASRSDIDDIIPILTAYQIERRKLHERLSSATAQQLLKMCLSDQAGSVTGEALQLLAQITDLEADDLGRLSKIWGNQTAVRLLNIAQNQQEIAVRSLAGSFADYKRATRRWWQNVEKQIDDVPFSDCPVYFVSSNTHSLANLISGHALRIESTLHEFLHQQENAELHQEYEAIQKRHVPSRMENFLYYVLKKYEAGQETAVSQRLQNERESGISRVVSGHAFDIEVQVTQLSQIQPQYLDPRLQMNGLEKLQASNALIVNIDYPLGMAAYQVLTEIARNIAEIRGIYIMGKAATLNGRVGDIMIPNVVHDEHSLNTYLFNNCFTAPEVDPYLNYGTVMDNQKAITVPGTFLQNEGYMSVFYQEGYTDMEMEAGPYLSAVYEMVRPRRHPYNEIVTLHQAAFPIGVLHYASDTPFSKGHNLGSQNLSYFGMDPTYATMIAILRAILATEIEHQEKK
ncbi:MAG: hypothetical protein AAF614_04030 [Chloroflexota bacterium]